MHFLIVFLLLGASQALLVPGPPGPYSVAIKDFELIDLNRTDTLASEANTKRRFMASVYLPIDAGHNCEPQFEPYMPPLTASVFGKQGEALGVPQGTVERFEMQSCNISTVKFEKNVKKKDFPVAVFSPGYGGSRLLYGALARSLASLGYIVFTVDHTYETYVVEFPDGTVAYAIGIDTGNATVFEQLAENETQPTHNAVVPPDSFQHLDEPLDEELLHGSFLPAPTIPARVSPVKIQILPLRRNIVPTNRVVSRRDTPSSSSEGQPASEKRVRAYKPKVKCDEAKPACLRCTSTGRKCDGYARITSKKDEDRVALVDVSRSPGPTRGPPLSPLRISSGEIRALEYFCVRLAPEMGMYFDADFWSSFVVQASVAEPALRHALVALGVVAEQREILDNNTAVWQTSAAVAQDRSAMPNAIRGLTADNDDPVALLNYNKSIGLLAKLALSPENTNIVLLACILFVCVEFLRGDGDTAIRHFKGGMAIIVGSVSRADGSASSRLTIDRIKHSMLPSFNRVEMLYALFGNDASWPYPVTLPSSVPVTFSSIGHARDSIVHLMNLSLRFIRSTAAYQYEPSVIIPSSAFNEQTALLNQLQLWRSRFSAYQLKHASELTPNDIYASNVLEIQRLVAYTWVSICMSPYECAHDAHISTYEAAVSLAEQLPTVTGTDAQRARYSSTFTFDVEIVGPIHLISLKCRDPAVRRRAIAVLRGTHRREGMWDSKMTIVVAERVMAIEEAGLEEGELPSEEVRVHQTGIAGEEGFISPLNYTVTHMAKPTGVYGDWLTWQEQISVDGM